MKSTITLLFMITCFFACKEDQYSDSLKRLTLEESIARLNKGDHQYYYAKYKDSVGQELSPELKEKLTKGRLSRSFPVFRTYKKANHMSLKINIIGNKYYKIG